MLQGLALGGEYGGAAVYVAEHVPDSRRGFYTSFIQTTATLGLFMSLDRDSRHVASSSGEPSSPNGAGEFRSCFRSCWCIVSFYIRMQLGESPLYAKLKAEGGASTAPIRESFDTWPKWKVVLQVLFGVTAGQAVT